MAARKSSKRALTDSEVQAHKFVEGRSPFLWDSGTGAVGGFYVRATPAGGLQFGIQFRVGTKNKRLSLGPVANWKSVADARQAADAKLQRWRQEGVDPAVGASGTMADVWKVYIEALTTGRGRRGKQRAGRPASRRSIIEAEHHWKNHLEPVLGALPPNKVTPSLVRQIHGDITRQRRTKRKGRGATRAGGLYAANRVLESLRAAWRIGQAAGITRNIPDPFVSYTPNAEIERRDYIRRDDAARFMAAVEQEPHGYREFWKLAILTGARTGELLAIEWRDVDLKARRLTLRGIEGTVTKNREVQVLPLTNAAVDAFKALPKADGKRVFPFTRPKTSWKRIMKASKLEGLRPHDVRRSVGSWLGAAGVSLPQIQATLGHKSNVTSKVYVQLGQDDEAKLAALEAQAAAVARYTGKVVSIDAARKKKAVTKAAQRRAAR
jgi:integrase